MIWICVAFLLYAFGIPQRIFDYGERKFGTTSMYTPEKPFVEVQKRQLLEARGRALERELKGAANALANKDYAQLSKAEAKIAEYVRDEERIHSFGVYNPVPQAGASYGSANLEEFRILKSNPTAGEYEFQLDARQVWQATKVVVHGPAKVTIKGTGQVCSGDANCVGPNGQDGPAKTSRFQPEDFPVGEAFCQALVVKFGDTILRQVGSEKTFDLPAGVHEVSFMANIRKSWVHVASGGFRVTMLVQ